MTRPTPLQQPLRTTSATLTVRTPHLTGSTITTTNRTRFSTTMAARSPGSATDGSTTHEVVTERMVRHLPLVVSDLATNSTVAHNAIGEPTRSAGSAAAEPPPTHVATRHLRRRGSTPPITAMVYITQSVAARTADAVTPLLHWAGQHHQLHQSHRHRSIDINALRSRRCDIGCTTPG